MTQMFRIHEFCMRGLEKPIYVEFWGPKEWQASRETHEKDAMERDDWVKSIINSFPDAWRALPHHQYLDFLSKQGFEYEEYLIRPSAYATTILCRTVAHVDFAAM